MHPNVFGRSRGGLGIELYQHDLTKQSYVKSLKGQFRRGVTAPASNGGITGGLVVEEGVDAHNFPRGKVAESITGTRENVN